VNDCKSQVRISFLVAWFTDKSTNPAAVLGEPDVLAELVVPVLHPLDDKRRIKAIVVQVVCGERVVHVRCDFPELLVPVQDEER